MHPVNQVLVGIACLVIIVSAVWYVSANSKSGCFLGFCGAVIKTPG